MVTIVTRIVAPLALGPVWDSRPATLIAKATIILLAACLLAALLRRGSAGARHLVWQVALAGVLLAPALAVWTPLAVPVLPAMPPRAPAAHARSTAPLPSIAPAPGAVSADARASARASTPADRSAADAGTGSARRATERRDVATDVRSFSSLLSAALAAARSAALATPLVILIVGIWAALALGLLGSLVWSAVAVRAIVRRARRLDGPAWQVPLVDAADRMGLDALPQLLVSGETRMPFACGVRAPTIVLPEECEGWSTDRRRAVLLHELAHVQRRDVLGHLVGRVACACYWFHPLVWVAARRMCAESERACDDLALACGTRASDYAEHLLEIVTSVRRGALRTSAVPAAALAMARRRELEGRLLAILDPDLPHTAPSRRRRMVMAASVALGAGLVAAAAPTRRAGAPRSDPGASSTAQASAPSAAGAPSRAGEPHDDGRRASARPAWPHGLRSTVATASVASPARNQSAAVPRSAPVAEARAGAEPDERPVLLAKVLRSDSSAALRRIAAWGLEQYPESREGGDALVAAVRQDADARVREMAAWSLASHDERRDAVDALVAALHADRDDDVRATAAWALGTLGAEPAADALVATLSDSSVAVRSRAAWALGTIAPKQAPAALVSMLRVRDSETRRLAAWALFQIQDPTTLPALEAALHAESDPEGQRALIRAIAATGPASVTALRGLLESPDARLRSVAVRALAGGEAAGPWPWPWPEPRPTP